MSKKIVNKGYSVKNGDYLYEQVHSSIQLAKESYCDDYCAFEELKTFLIAKHIPERFALKWFWESKTSANKELSIVKVEQIEK